MRSATAASRPTSCATSRHAGARLDRERWHELGDTGVFSLRVPEADGGARARDVRSGRSCSRSSDARSCPARSSATELAARISRRGGRRRTSWSGWSNVDDERSSCVEHPDDLDALLVLDADGVHASSTPAAIEGVDADAPARRAHAGPGASPARCPDGELLGDADARRRVAPRRHGADGRAASSASRARTVELATEYAKEREQFGRADRLVPGDQAPDRRHARAIGGGACARCTRRRAPLDGRSDDDADRAAAVAKVVAGEAALGNAKACIQVHGGIGYTWELDVQRYWKRACGARHPLRQRRSLGRGCRDDDLTIV